MAVLRLSGTLPCGLVKENGCRGRGVERFDAAGHGNANASVSAALHFFRQASAFVADEQRDWFAPINFPGRESRSDLAKLGRSVRRPYGGSERLFVRAGCNGTHIRDAQLRQQNRQRHPGENRKMQRGSSRSTQRLW